MFLLAGKLRVQKRFHDTERKVRPHDTCTDRQHICIVVLPCQSRRHCVRTQRTADPLHLVGCDRNTDPGRAAVVSAGSVSMPVYAETTLERLQKAKEEKEKTEDAMENTEDKMESRYSCLFRPAHTSP